MPDVTSPGGVPDRHRLREVKQAPQPASDTGVSAPKSEHERADVTGRRRQNGGQVRKEQVERPWGPDGIGPSSFLLIGLREQCGPGCPMDRKRFNLDAASTKCLDLTQQKSVRHRGIVACQIADPHVPTV